MFNKILILILINISLILAQDFSGIRIYINPGHGGHDSDDRFIPATGFWESEGNLTKGLYLKSILDSLGAITGISRTTNTTADDLGLSVISERANNFGADFFHSIHSNAFQGNANYTLLLYKEVNNQPVFPDAYKMGNIMANSIYTAHRTTTKYNRGDYSFLGFNLGVLKNLAMPGTLSEGSFHDYIPESWRLRNDAYLKHEAWAMVKAFIEYFELSPLNSGEIAGILRDQFIFVAYNSITQNDKYKPLNFGKAILLPDSIVYEGDSYNNGFFFFDNINPGNYNLILEAEDYNRDTISVTVNANKTTFADNFLMQKPDYSPPTILSYSPSENLDVRLDANIIFNFSIKMNKDATESAFSISPNILGTFKWELNDKKMTFIPNDFLTAETDYEISITNSAKSFYDVNLSDSFNHSFRTRSALNLLSSYPEDNAEDISTTVKLKIKFSGAIDQNSLGGNIFFENELGNSVPLVVEEIDYANGLIIFEPTKPLGNDSLYQVRLLKGIKDTEGSNLKEDIIIKFRTEIKKMINGVSLDNFEKIGDWLQPIQSPLTSGVEANSTSLIISKKKNIDGDYSGRLLYTFANNSGGICQIYNQSEPLISSNSYNNLGIWIFGDLSFNTIEFILTDSNELPIWFTIDTLNWTGWKFKEIDLSNYSIMKFNSIVIKQNINGEKKGQLYLDALQSDIITGINKNHNLIEHKFELEQNYPNPFNPVTTIKYSIPDIISSKRRSVEFQNKDSQSFNTRTVLKIYDVLGKEIKTLVNENQKPGTYSVEFDGSSLSSGVYYYQLRYGERVETKKLLLLK